jgi:hypothetical protein
MSTPKQKLNKERRKKEKKIKKTDSKKHARDFGMKSCIVLDWFEDGIRRLICNIRGNHFTQYLGIPKDHPLAGFNYNDIPLNCHGGLTFSSKGDGKIHPKGYWWYGWDYAHIEDYCYFGLPEIDKRHKELNEHDWTLEEVLEDGWEAHYDFKKLINLAEKIAKKSK